MRPLCGTYIIVTMASLVSAPAPHPRSSRQISSCHTWMMTRARRIPHNKLYLLHPISDTCAQGYTHVILLFHSRYSIILFYRNGIATFMASTWGSCALSDLITDLLFNSGYGVGYVCSPLCLVIFVALERTLVCFSNYPVHLISNSVRCVCLRQDQCTIACLRNYHNLIGTATTQAATRRNGERRQP